MVFAGTRMSGGGVCVVIINSDGTAAWVGEYNHQVSHKQGAAQEGG